MSLGMGHPPTHPTPSAHPPPPHPRSPSALVSVAAATLVHSPPAPPSSMILEAVIHRPKEQLEVNGSWLRFGRGVSRRVCVCVCVTFSLMAE